MSAADRRYWSALNKLGKVIGALFSLWGSVFAIWGLKRLFQSHGNDITETMIIEGGGFIVTAVGFLLLRTKPFRLDK